MSRNSQRRSPQTRLVGWRRFGAHLALIGLVFEVLIGLGHGGLLGATAAVADETQSGYIEICTPTGIKRIAWDSLPPAEDADDPSQPQQPQTAKAPCIVCAALGACALACLDTEIVIDWHAGTALVPPQDRETVSPGRACQPKQSRAPPLSV